MELVLEPINANIENVDGINDWVSLSGITFRVN